MTIGIYHTGAARRGAPQPDAGLSLGGYGSSTPALLLEAYRNAPIAQLEVRGLSVETGVGLGALEVMGNDTVRWTAPGDDAGEETAVPVGVATWVASGDGKQRILLYRNSGVALGGQETVQLVDVLRNVVGGSFVEEADSLSGVGLRRSVMVRAEVAITGLRFWVDPEEDDGYVLIGVEEPDSSGAIQTIANERTSTTVVGYDNPDNYDDGVVVGDLDAGEEYGLWIWKSIGAASAADAVARVAIRARWFVGAEQHDGYIRGLFRVAEDGIAGYYLFLDSDAQDPEVATADEFSETLPFTLEDADLAEGRWVADVYYRNRWGLWSAPTRTILRVDGEGAVLPVPPSAPELLSVTAVADGKITVDAVYYPQVEGDTEGEVSARAADEFVVWVTADGSEPDPEVDEPTAVVSMGSGESPARRRLNWTTASGFIDGAPVNVAVGTRRDGDVDSETVIRGTAVASRLGPGRTRGRLYWGDVRAEQVGAAAGPDESIVVDGDVEWRIAGESVGLWIDDVLAFRVVNGVVYIPSEWQIISEGVSGSMADALEPIEVSGDVVSIGVNGTKVWEMDANTMVMKATPWRFLGSVESLAAALPSVPAEAPIWPRYSDTLLQVWDGSVENWVSWAVVETEGVAFRYLINRLLSQSAVEAL